MTSSEERSVIEDFWSVQWEEAQKEADQDCPVRRSITLVSFLSFSRGRKRKRRKHPREVTLIRYGKRAWSLVDTPRNGLDIVAREVLGNLLAPGEDEYKEFLKRIEKLKPK